jgi:DUF4097 and DUF4098 domain-containing protein YvlB
MPNRFFTCLLVTLAAVTSASPASAAVTLRGLLLDDGGPRPGWYDRYQDSRQGPETVDKSSQTFKVGAEGALDLTGIAGDVRVTGGSGNEIRVEATKRVRHRNADEAKRLLGELRIEMNNFNGRVEVRSVYPRRNPSGERNISARVDYVVTVPVAAMVAVKSISGNVIVSGVRGEVRAETVSGDVSVDSTPNLAVAKTVSGDVTARDIGGPTTLVLSTVSGTVIASGLKVRALEAGSVSGDVRLSGMQVERVEAKSVSGNIDFDAPLVKAGRYEFTSHSGNVRVVISGNTGFELDADTFSGSVRSDVPVTLRTVGRDDRDRRRGASNRAIRGSFGDASALLAIRSHSGSVVITKK